MNDGLLGENRLYSTWLAFTIKKNLPGSLDIKSHIKPDISILFSLSPSASRPLVSILFCGFGSLGPFPKELLRQPPCLQPQVPVIG